MPMLEERWQWRAVQQRKHDGAIALVVVRMTATECIQYSSHSRCGVHDADHWQRSIAGKRRSHGLCCACGLLRERARLV